VHVIMAVTRGDISGYNKQFKIGFAIESKVHFA